MTEIELIINLHLDAERQGPGSPQETKKALDLIELDKSEPLKIADIGCGSGSQTITLAQNTKGLITAVDLFPEFLKKLDEKVRNLNLESRVTTAVQSMENLQFNNDELDLIWSEGAIYNIGFEEGIKNWRRFLKPGGYLAISEISWITDSRPEELEAYWLNEYPQIDTIANKIRLLENNGYSPTAHFILPPYCWLDNYYKPMQERFDAFLNRYKNSELARQIVDNEKNEIRIYEKFKKYYSYGFYITQKQ
jgi:ubiquinone/menaquinone biosynthesis C-methylase UbiE